MLIKTIATRIGTSILLLLIVSITMFFAVSLAPGSVAETILGQNATPATVARLTHLLHLDEPLPEQYWNWLVNALHGDLGVSVFTGEAVGPELGVRLGVTLSLVISTLVFVVIIGVLLGIVSAIRQGWLGRLVDILSVVGYAVPGFWLALLLVSAFANQVPIFPAVGYTDFSQSPFEWARGLVLPVATLSVSGVALIAKQTRTSMVETLSRDYVRVLLANGFSRWSVIFRHALRNAAIPVASTTGIMVVALLSSAVLVEQIFALPGLGSLAIRASQQHDLPYVIGAALFFTFIVIVVNLAVDLLIGWLNPKARTS